LHILKSLQAAARVISSPRERKRRMDFIKKRFYLQLENNAASVFHNTFFVSTVVLIIIPVDAQCLKVSAAVASA
jgi:hypothetical protein